MAPRAQHLFFRLVVAAFLFASFSCNIFFRPHTLQYEDYRISPDKPRDSAMIILMLPYSDSVNKKMNGVIGIVEKDLEKKQPESTLGNFMADALLIMAEKKFNTSVDAAFVNYGGIRLTQLPAGSVTRGKIFELMPFDNLLVLQRLSGSVLQQFLDNTAARGGWPVAGMTMQIRNKKAVNVMIKGKPIDHSATYTIVNSDYVANGGDDASMLKTLPQISVGYLMRDAFFDYIEAMKSQGKNITANIENRVSHAE